VEVAVSATSAHTGSPEGRLSSASRSAGITGPSSLLERVAAAPDAALVAAVCGPGGTGKSTLLQAVARAYRAAGAEPGTDGGPILVDDAHRFGPAALGRLVDLAAVPGARLVVAHRPGAGGAGLTALRAAVARGGLTIMLGPLPRDAARTRIARLLGEEPTAAVVDLVHAQSGGVPLLVDIVTRTLAHGFGRAGPLPAALVERHRHLVDALDPDIRVVLEAIAAGAPAECAVLAALTRLPAHQLATAVEAARATGFLDGDDRPVPFIRALLLATAPALRVRSLTAELAAARLAQGAPLVPTAREMIGSGATGEQVAALFDAAADEAMPRAPALTADLLSAAVLAGGDPATTAARHSGAAALAGDLDTALRLADQALADPVAVGADTARVAAAVALAHRGFPGRSAALLAALPAEHPVGPVWAVPALLAVGDAGSARSAMEAAHRADATPGLARAAGLMVATALMAAVDGTPGEALGGLARATVLLEPVAATTLLPDTPAALTALVALQVGEYGTADVALRRAAAGLHGGRPAQLRHLLLHGWVLLLRGRFTAAQEALSRADTTQRLQLRDELLAAALQAALARRTGSAAGLATSWARVRAALLHHPVDLFTLLPLGELAVAAALLQDDGHLAPHLDDAQRILRDLGDPVLWAAPLHWAQAQAAVAAGRRGEAEQHVTALQRTAAATPDMAHPAALAAAAGTWVQVRWGAIDQEAAIAAARGLAAVGQPWEGAKLAGQAATRCEGRGAAAALHACARELFRSTDGDGEVDPAPPPTEPGITPLVAEAEEPVLSERELEVGRLILDGLTYRQIGESLYISAKTVENHVARMRRRLGAASRNELFDRLRDLGAAVTPER
jgi:DNA-binding CsgD family transcriptional regulator